MPRCHNANNAILIRLTSPEPFNQMLLFQLFLLVDKKRKHNYKKHDRFVRDANNADILVTY